MDQARPGKRGIWVRKLCKGGGGGLGDHVS